MRATTMRGDFKEFLRAVRGASVALDWSTWVAVAGTATAHPQDWVAAVQSLSTDDQFHLLDLMRRDEAGPFADHLLLVTARSANEFEDPQVREFLLGDAQEAADRTVDFMEQQREGMRRLVGQAVERSAGAMEAAVEVVRLEARLNELRIAEIDTDYEQVHELERQISQLERFQHALESYDRAGRTALKEQLDQTTAALRAQRSALESAIAEAIAERDQAQDASDTSAAQLAALQSEVEQLRTRQVADAATVAQLSETIAELGVKSNRLRAERSRQEAELAAQEQAWQALREAVAQDAARLQELRQSPAAQADQQISKLVQQLWQLLPADLSDPEFSSGTGGSRR